MKRFFIILLCVLNISCTRTTEDKKNENLLNEYSSILYNSLQSSQKDEIQIGIDYIQKLLDEGYSQEIHSIYYNKAQLYVKLDEYKNAIECLHEMENGLFRDLLESTLLIKSEEYEKAKNLLVSMKRLYDEKLSDPHLEQSKRVAIICEKLQILQLLNDKPDEYYNDSILSKDFTVEELKKIEKVHSTSNKQLIDGFWPD